MQLFETMEFPAACFEQVAFNITSTEITMSFTVFFSGNGKSSRTHYSPQFSDGENEAPVEVRFSSSGKRWSWRKSAAPPAPALALSALSWLLMGTAKVTFPSWGGASLEYLVQKWWRALSTSLIWKKYKWFFLQTSSFWGKLDETEISLLKKIPAHHRQKTHQDSPVFFPFALSQCAKQGDSPLGSQDLVQRDLVPFHQTQPYSTTAYHFLCSFPLWHCPNVRADRNEALSDATY